MAGRWEKAMSGYRNTPRRNLKIITHEIENSKVFTRIKNAHKEILVKGPLIDTLKTVQRLDVIRPLERGRLGHRFLAHAAPHHFHRFIFVRFHPNDHFFEHFADVPNAMAQQRGRHHRDIGAGHEHL